MWFDKLQVLSTVITTTLVLDFIILLLASPILQCQSFTTWNILQCRACGILISPSVVMLPLLCHYLLRRIIPFRTNQITCYDNSQKLYRNLSQCHMLHLAAMILNLFNACLLYSLPLIPFNHNLTLIASSLANTNIIFLTHGINNFSDGLSSFLFSSVPFPIKMEIKLELTLNTKVVCVDFGEFGLQ